MSKGCISTPPDSVARRSACALASDHMEPWTTTLAPKASRRSRMKAGVLVGRQTVVGMPSERPAWATASPAFPPEEETSIFAPASCARRHAKLIPRSLKLPLCCRLSSFSHTWRPSSRLSGSDRSSGVRTYIPRCAAPRASPRAPAIPLAPPAAAGRPTRRPPAAPHSRPSLSPRPLGPSRGVVCPTRCSGRRPGAGRLAGGRRGAARAAR